MSEITLRIEGRDAREHDRRGPAPGPPCTWRRSRRSPTHPPPTGVLGASTAVAERFAGHDREHAGALTTMTLALTLEVRRTPSRRTWTA